jgi:hypothetical protein
MLLRKDLYFIIVSLLYVLHLPAAALHENNLLYGRVQPLTNQSLAI